MNTNFLLFRGADACIQGNDTARAIGMPTPCTHPMQNGALCVEPTQTPQTCLLHAPAKQSIPHACTPCITVRNWGCQLGLPHVTCEISAISESNTRRNRGGVCVWELIRSPNTPITATLGPYSHHFTIIFPLYCSSFLNRNND